MALAFRARPVTPSIATSRARTDFRWLSRGAPGDPTASLAMKPRRARRSSGFTMLEILTVVVIIGILAATASPILIYLLRDRDVARMAMRVGDVFRFARMRALERQAVLVRFSATGGPGSSPGLQIYEAVVTAAGAQAPTCSGTAWGAGSTSSKLVTSFPAAPADIANNPPWEDASAQLFDPSGTQKAFADICYTARGRTFVRYDPGGSFAPLTGVAQLTVTNTRTEFRRTIFILPSTVARQAL